MDKQSSLLLINAWTLFRKTLFPTLSCLSSEELGLVGGMSSGPTRAEGPHLVSTDPPTARSDLGCGHLALPSPSPCHTALIPYYFYLKMNRMGEKGCPLLPCHTYSVGTQEAYGGHGVKHRSSFLPVFRGIFLVTC